MKGAIGVAEIGDEFGRHQHTLGGETHWHAHQQGDWEHRHVVKLGRTFFKSNWKQAAWSIDLDVVDDWAYAR